MLQQMIHVISGMKDTAKLGKLQSALIMRVCEISKTDPVTHLQLLAGSIQESFTHEQADYYAHLRFDGIEPEVGESAHQFHARIDRERKAFAKQYPNWNIRKSTTGAPAWRPRVHANAADALREWGDAQ
jgi:hypothetical protein